MTLIADTEEAEPPIYCVECGKNERDWDVLTTCAPKDVRGLQGLPYEWDPDGPTPPPDQRCHQCWVPIGSFHHFACSVETCPWCNGQLLYCGHYA